MLRLKKKDIIPKTAQNKPNKSQIHPYDNNQRKTSIKLGGLPPINNKRHYSNLLVPFIPNIVIEPKIPKFPITEVVDQVIDFGAKKPKRYPTPKIGAGRKRNFDDMDLEIYNETFEVSERKKPRISRGQLNPSLLKKTLQDLKQVENLPFLNNSKMFVAFDSFQHVGSPQQDERLFQALRYDDEDEEEDSQNEDDDNDDESDEDGDDESEQTTECSPADSPDIRQLGRSVISQNKPNYLQKLGNSFLYSKNLQQPVFTNGNNTNVMKNNAENPPNQQNAQIQDVSASILERRRKTEEKVLKYNQFKRKIAQSFSRHAPKKRLDDDENQENSSTDDNI